MIKFKKVYALRTTLENVVLRNSLFLRLKLKINN